MTTPILFIYAIGFIFFFLALEEDRKLLDLIYLALSFFTNWIGYYLSYTNTDYTLLAYFPLGLVVVTVILLIYTIWSYIPWSDERWDKNHELGEREEGYSD